MKIFVFSDSHNHCEPMIRELIKHRGKYDFVIHLGDCCRDTEYIDKYIVPIPSLYVAGNNDFYFTGNKNKFPFERTVELEGKKLYMCHGHLQRVKSEYQTIKTTAMALKCNIALFGHTHVPVCIEKEGVILCNPGSVGVPSAGKLTYGVLSIEDDKVNFEIREAE